MNSQYYVNASFKKLKRVTKKKFTRHGTNRVVRKNRPRCQY